MSSLASWVRSFPSMSASAAISSSWGVSPSAPLIDTGLLKGRATTFRTVSR